MNLVSGLFRLLVLGLLAWLVARLIRLVAFPARTPPRQAGERTRPRAGDPEALVRDPHCGVALPRSRAIEADGEFFCSQTCRHAYGASKMSRASR
ncbi:MAG: hypothetical protein Kow0062_13500 [Acidobacteriota bacterium]